LASNTNLVALHLVAGILSEETPGSSNAAPIAWSRARSRRPN